MRRRAAVGAAGHQDHVGPELANPLDLLILFAPVVHDARLAGRSAGERREQRLGCDRMRPHLVPAPAGFPFEKLDGAPLSVMTPSKRSFTTRGSSTTEAALLTRGASQLYISLGDTTTEGAIAVRIYHKPMVLLIWFGPVLMAFGGMLSLSDRRLRVGAPKPARVPRGLQPAE